MTPPITIHAGTPQAADVYTVAPGYHVSFLAGAGDSAAPFDLIEVVLARHRGTAEHRHSGTTWIHVLEGHLQIASGDGDVPRAPTDLAPGERYAIPSGLAYAAANPGRHAVRFLIGGQPGTIASYLAQMDGGALA